MTYENAGDFTKKQIDCVEELKKIIKKMGRHHLSVYCNEQELQVFKREEFNNAAPFGEHNRYPIPYLSGGYVEDSGAPGEICFDPYSLEKEGYY